MAGKKTHPYVKAISEKLQGVNKAFGRFEGEVEKTVTRIRKQSEKSSKNLRKNFDELVDKINSSPLYSKATEKTEEVIVEVRKIADDVVTKVKKIDTRLSNQLLTDVRASMDDLKTRVQGLEFVEAAKDRAAEARNRMFEALSIPTQDDVDSLTRKLVVLERKVKTLVHRGTNAR